MKWSVLVLGCYGLMVGSAEAGERWSTDACRRLQEMKADVYRLNKDDAEHIVWMLIAILAHQQNNCGINTEAEGDAASAASVAAVRRRVRAAPSTQPRQPLHCDTTPKAYGGSYLNCN